MSTSLIDRAGLLREQAANGVIRRGAPLNEFPIRAGKTGSGDQLLVLSWTADQLAREIAAGARMFRTLGITSGMRVANTLPGALTTPGALLLGDVIEAIGALDVPLGVTDSPAAAKGAWELVDRVETAVLILDPLTATTLFEAMPPAARAWWQGIIWLRTDATPAAPSVPSSFTGWQRTWLAVPEVANFTAHATDGKLFVLDESLKGAVAEGRLTLQPQSSRPYATSLVVDAFDPATRTFKLR